MRTHAADVTDVGEGGGRTIVFSVIPNAPKTVSISISMLNAILYPFRTELFG